jgi:hypothetical protein
MKPQLVPAANEQVFEIARTEDDLWKAYEILKDAPVVGLDTETGGFVPQKVPLWSVQL